ncbi:MAG: hypothetical protein WC344_01470 [Bacilli bacterium]|jgi:DNA-directed RNA polymerase specialized sigma24 family protein
MSNDTVCDEQLILCYRQNSLEAYRLLLNRKHQCSLPLLKKYVNQSRLIGADMNDYYSIFLESFHKAIKRYMFDGNLFQTYFLKVLNRDLAGFYRTLSNPNSPRNNSFSLDSTVTPESTLTFHDVLADDRQKIDARNYANVNGAFCLIESDSRTNYEESVKRIVMLKAAGYSADEIAKITNIKVTVVRRRLNDFYHDELGMKIKKCLM